MLRRLSFIRYNAQMSVLTVCLDAHSLFSLLFFGFLRVFKWNCFLFRVCGYKY